MTRMARALITASCLVAASTLVSASIADGLVQWGTGVGTELLKQGFNIRDLKNDFDALSPDDKANDANYPPGPNPLPSACTEHPDQCAQCGFESALADLQATRYRLEKLRRIYASTKSFVGHSLAIGDSMAGSAGVGGLAWVDQRLKIEQSFKGMQTAYDNKYTELMAGLKKSLESLAKCEEQVYGEKDWYDRYGFMYYEFMAGRYERAD
jgi:hypothetical protein